MQKKITLLALVTVGLGLTGITLLVGKTEEKKDQVSGPTSVVKSPNTAIDASSLVSGPSDLKIRYIDTWAAMRDSKEGIEVAKEIEKERLELARGLEAEEKKLTQAANEFKSKSSTMSDTARTKEEQRLRKMDLDLKNKLQESEETLKLSMQQKTERLAKEVDEAVAKIAMRADLDAVLDMYSGRVVYLKKGSPIAITEHVVKQMDENSSVRLAKAKTQKAKAVTA